MCNLLSCLNICGINNRFTMITVIWSPNLIVLLRIYLLRGCLVSEGSTTKALAWPEPLCLSVICKARLPSANFGRVWEERQRTVSLLSEQHRECEGACGWECQWWLKRREQREAETHILIWGSWGNLLPVHLPRMMEAGAGGRLSVQVAMDICWWEGTGSAATVSEDCLGWRMKWRMPMGGVGSSGDLSTGGEAEWIFGAGWGLPESGVSSPWQR